AAGAELALGERLRVGDRELEHTNVTGYLQIDPGRRLSRIGGNFAWGHQIDFANARVGRGREVALFGTWKPTDHLAFDASTDRQWLDVDAGAGAKGRLFTAQIERLKTTYNFSARASLRLIGEYLDVDREPSLYTFAVPARSGSFAGSGLFAYQVNWQTVLFAGYGDDRAQDPVGALRRLDRVVFLKVSYAIQG